jgi:hypothetical protein
MSMWLLNIFFWIPNVMAITPLEQAKNDFTFQFGNYRTTYTEYQLKKAQYQTDATFARQEELVVAVKAMLSARDLVWSTYFQALTVDLSENTGVNEETKSVLLERLTNAGVILNQHSNGLNSLANIKEMLGSAAVVNDKKSEFYSTTYSTLAKIRRGRLLMAAKDLQSFGESLKQNAVNQILDEGERGTRIRGIDEALTILATSQTQLQSNEELLNRYEGSYQPQQLYEEYMKGFEPIYADIVRVYGLLKELSVDIEI